MATKYKYMVQGQDTVVRASSYDEAAFALFGQRLYEIPGRQGLYRTTYIRRHRGYAEVLVYKQGEKQGSYWGVDAAIPKKYIIRRMVN